MKLKLLLLTLFFPLFLLSQEQSTTPKESTNNGVTQTSITVESSDIAEEILKKQIDFAKNILKNLNEELYLDENFKELNYENEINYLKTKISANERENNTLAIKRDEIKILYFQEQQMFNNTLKQLVNAKRTFKDKNEIEDIINRNILFLEKNSIEKFKSFYENEKNSDNSVSKELITNYLELYDQSTQQNFTLGFLKENISQFRTTNFFIDKFNLQFLVSTIDSYPYISSVSNLTRYYLKFSVGDICVVLLILFIFRLFIAKVIHYFISFLIYFIKRSKKKRREDNDEEDENLGLESYLEESIEKPLLLGLYTLAIQLSLYILIKDNEILNQIIPWINTFYMGILTWAIYSLLSNSFSNYAQHLVEKYPNVRREMIVFMMRIIKVVLILLVILFLFTQLGIDIKAIAASLGVGGIAIALASKDTLANFFGSLNIMTDNSFSQGDWIVANEVEGTVVDIRMRTTRIRTFDNAMITVPNSEIANTHIKNYSKRRIGRRIKMSIGVTYENKIEDIINLKKDILEMLANHPNIATDRNSASVVSKKFEAIKRDDLHGIKRNLMVYIDEYDASSINILIYCFTKSPDWEEWLKVKEDVIIKIHKLVEKNNCDFAYPTQTLHLKK